MKNSLADRYASAKLAADAAAAELELLRAEILATGVETIEGDRYVVTVGLAERKALDNAVVKALLTPAQIIEATKVSVSTTVRVKEIKPAVTVTVTINT